MTDLEGATDVGVQGTWASSAGEFAARWNARTPEEREAFTARIVNDAACAASCRQADHRGEIDRLRTALLDVTFVREVAVNRQDPQSGFAKGQETPTVSGQGSTVGSDISTPQIGVQSRIVCRECAEGKHAACDGSMFNEDLDVFEACGCAAYDWDGQHTDGGGR